MKTADILALEVAAHLLPLGYRRVRGRSFLRDVSNEVEGAVTLTVASEHATGRAIEVIPHVGVRHKVLAPLLAELRGEGSTGAARSTYGCILGYVMPERRYMSWYIDPSDLADLHKQAAAIASAIDEYGTPFMEQLSSLRAISDALEKAGPDDQPAQYARPVALFLAGRSERAKEDVDATLRRMQDRDDPAAEAFRFFAKRLHERVAQAQDHGEAVVSDD